MNRPMCKDCYYYDSGYCRHSPPDFAGEWPAVKMHDWCGQFAPIPDVTPLRPRDFESEYPADLEILKKIQD